MGGASSAVALAHWGYRAIQHDVLLGIPTFSGIEDACNHF